MADRVSFEEAISERVLLKDFFEKTSFPHQVTLKALYGAPLSATRVNPVTGWSELDYWALIQGSFEQDELGYPTKITPIPYDPKEYNQLWAVIGRRAGKTSQLQSFIIAYEATLGGHEDYVGKKQECIVYLVAQKLDVAEKNLPFVEMILDSSPLLAKEIVAGKKGQISLKNGITILPSPPSIKAQRGLACPVVAMDEVSFWYKEAENANPDFEVERSVAWSQIQFPNWKRVGISTPWSKEGLLWRYHRAGTEGIKLPAEERKPYKGILTAFGTSASYENTLIKRDRLEAELLADPEGFTRESLCIFPDSISGFLHRPLIEIAVSKGKGVAQRPPVDREKIQKEGGQIPIYVAAIDPAFRHDDFAFTILHRENNGIVVDVLKRWVPFRGQRLNPKEVLSEVKQVCQQYDITTLFSDQYQLESLQQLAYDIGLDINGIDFTAKSKAKIFGNLQQLFNQQKISLLDPYLNDDARATQDELIQLERRLTAQGGVQIGAPEGKKDDMAAVLALASSQAVHNVPEVVTVDKPKEPTLFERGIASLNRKRAYVQSEGY